MQITARDYENILKSDVKAGPYKAPVCIVEVDRYSFVAGKMTELQFDEIVGTLETTTVRVPGRNYTTEQSYGITFPAPGLSLDNVTSEFGVQRASGPHQGMDIAPGGAMAARNFGKGLPIVAAWGGKVVLTRRNPMGGYGNYVDILHSDNLKTRYAHLETIMVQNGQTVQQGQQIGTMGNTGNVMSGGRAVTGHYGDPKSPRSQGKGTHLHFEVQESSDGGRSFKKVNPRPYLSGAKRAPAPVTHQSSRARAGGGGQVKGFKGTTLINENFKSRGWINNERYVPNDLYTTRTSYEIGGSSSGNASKTVFRPVHKKGEVARLDIKVNTVNQSLLTIRFATNFNMSEGDKVVVSYTDSKGKAHPIATPNLAIKPGLERTFTDVPVPAGAQRLRIDLTFGGVAKQGNKFITKYFKLSNIKLQEFAPTKQSAGSPTAKPNNDEMSELQGAQFVDMNVSEMIFRNNTQKFEIPTGHFVFDRTITLDNVENVTISRSTETDTATLSMTLSDPDGFYTPDYNPFYFPDVFNNSPFAGVIQGVQTGVIAYNAPIRVFMGYGPYIIRVFTGSIDTVEVSMDNEPVIHVTARDMYKLVSDKVLTETKGYPEQGYVTNNTLAPGSIPANHRDIVQMISQMAIAAYPTSKVLPSIAVAQAVLETGWGTSKGYLNDYNIFGIKPSKDWNGPTGSWFTHEYQNGRWEGESLAFKKYRGYQQSFDDYIATLNKPLYNKVVSTTNYETAAWALQGAGYATDPRYANKLIDMIKQHGWVEFDNIALGNTNAPKPTPGPLSDSPETGLPKVPWLKSAVVQDLVEHAGMYKWRETSQDLEYPATVIEESYVISVNQSDGTYIRALNEEEVSIDTRTGAKSQGIKERFEAAKLESIPTPRGWLQPYAAEYGITFDKYSARVGDCINEVLKDTHYITYCDRYGTFRMEALDYNKPVVAKYTANEDLVSVRKMEDFTRARSHIMVTDGAAMNSFYDKEMMIAMKGELRTSSVEVPWATSVDAKRLVAEKMFMDMKRLARTLTAEVVCNPALDLLDRLIIIDKNTATNAEYIIKGITLSFDGDRLSQQLDLFWAGKGTVI